MCYHSFSLEKYRALSNMCIYYLYWEVDAAVYFNIAGTWIWAKTTNAFHLYSALEQLCIDSGNHIFILVQVLSI